jgi:hypothetical protein
MESTDPVRLVPTTSPTAADLDEALDAAVTRRIDSEERLRGHAFSVDVYRGIVLLCGMVRSEAEKRLAEEIAAGTSGVRAVASRLDVAGAPLAPYPVVVLPQIDAVVATARGPLGRLRRVVMDLRVRRVTHLVVELLPGIPGDVSLAERDGALVLIPVDAVRSATPTLVRVRLTPAEVAALRAFDARTFTSPAEGWEPPIDYRRGDVTVAQAQPQS